MIFTKTSMHFYTFFIKQFEPLLKNSDGNNLESAIVIRLIPKIVQDFRIWNISYNSNNGIFFITKYIYIEMFSMKY